MFNYVWCSFIGLIIVNSKDNEAVLDQRTDNVENINGLDKILATLSVLTQTFSENERNFTGQ